MPCAAKRFSPREEAPHRLCFLGLIVQGMGLGRQLVRKPRAGATRHPLDQIFLESFPSLLPHLYPSRDNLNTFFFRVLAAYQKYFGLKAAACHCTAD